MSENNAKILPMSFDIAESGDTLDIHLMGSWEGFAKEMMPDQDPRGDLLHAVQSRIAAKPVQVTFESSKLISWDTQLLVVVSKIGALVESTASRVDLSGLPEGVQALIKLSRAVPPRTGQPQKRSASDLLTTVGQSSIDLRRSAAEGLAFIAEAFQSFGRLFRGKAQFLSTDVIGFLQSTGPNALPIVGLINLLLGIILAFMGAVQLRQFGAEIFVADLVGLGQTREIAPMMTAIVMAGRTGAAYAAQLGTMQVNEEIDALNTSGFLPMDFLVLPRMLALAIMFPILVLYADALGIFGGYLVGVGMLDIGTVEYIEQTRQAIDLGDIAVGLVKASVFGVLIAVTGCMQGMQSGRSASAVGDATTKAVVSGIVAVIVMTAIFSVLTNILGI
jgi:phospholipid/cholesterol/gamma-HCH transport system permease protein